MLLDVELSKKFFVLLILQHHIKTQIARTQSFERHRLFGVTEIKEQ